MDVEREERARARAWPPAHPLTYGVDFSLFISFFLAHNFFAPRLVPVEVAS